jgi:hypothetical protein
MSGGRTGATRLKRSGLSASRSGCALGPARGRCGLIVAVSARAAVPTWPGHTPVAQPAAVPDETYPVAIDAARAAEATLRQRNCWEPLPSPSVPGRHPPRQFLNCVGHRPAQTACIAPPSTCGGAHREPLRGRSSSSARISLPACSISTQSAAGRATFVNFQTPTANPRPLVLTVAPDGNGVAIRADAQVPWQPARPASSLLRHVASGEVTITRSPSAPTVRKTLTGTAATALVNAVNSFPTTTAGIPDCGYTPERLQDELEFCDSHHTLIGIFTEGARGPPELDTTARRPELFSASKLSTAILHAVGQPALRQVVGLLRSLTHRRGGVNLAVRARACNREGPRRATSCLSRANVDDRPRCVRTRARESALTPQVTVGAGDPMSEGRIRTRRNTGWRHTTVYDPAQALHIDERSVTRMTTVSKGSTWRFSSFRKWMFLRPEARATRETRNTPRATASSG